MKTLELTDKQIDTVVDALKTCISDHTWTEAMRAPYEEAIASKGNLLREPGDTRKTMEQLDAELCEFINTNWQQKLDSGCLELFPSDLLPMLKILWSAQWWKARYEELNSR